MILYPVTEFVGRGLTRTILLFLKFHIERLEVHLIAFLGSDQLSKVNREAVCIVEHECILTVNHLGISRFRKIVIHESDAAVQCPEECELLFSYDAFNEFLLSSEFRICTAHVIGKLMHETAEERLIESEERITVTDCPSENSADHIAGLHV